MRAINGSERYYDNPHTTFGTQLAADLDVEPVYLRYNTGRAVSDSGQALARALERFVQAYPVPIEDLTLIGHSMGGLVLRSACHFAGEADLVWPRLVPRAFYLGSPHEGAPLAKLSRAAAAAFLHVDLPATQVIGRILDGRSAGLESLTDGDIVGAEWLAANPGAREDLELLPTARHFFFSATITRDPDHPLGQLVGDLLVRTPSAQGARLTETRFGIESAKYGGVLHHQLQNHPQIYAEIRRGSSG